MAPGDDDQPEATTLGGTTEAATPAGTATRQRILDAAEVVVLRDGVARLTLERAADEAGVSKGGVLYHFSTRNSLVTAMVTRLASSFDTNLENALGAGGSPCGDPGDGAGDRPGRFTRAYLAATLHPRPDPRASGLDRLGPALIAAVAADPDLLEPLRARYRAWQAELEVDGLDPALATLVRLAADGLWLSELFDLAPLPPAMRSAVETALVSLIGVR